MADNRALTDVVTSIPDLTGRMGRAWKTDLSAARAELEGQEDATIDVWIVEASWAHPAWHSYVIALMHLRPLGDARPTKLYLNGATHEMFVQALDPDGSRQAFITKGIWGPHCRPLTPANFAAQFIEPSDGAAATRIRDAVQRICDGLLSPDTDYIRHWMHLFGDNMVKDPATAGRTVIRTQPRDGSDPVEIVIPAHPGPQDLN